MDLKKRNDWIISQEAQQMFEKEPNFSPVEGNLYHWRGDLEISKKLKITLDLVLPIAFPAEPPRIYVIKSEKRFTHSHFNPETKELTLNTEWNPGYSLFEVVNFLRDLFEREKPMIAK